MYKILILTLREFNTTVRTKGFIIGLVLVPIMMAASGLVVYFTQTHVDTNDKKIAVIDYTGKIAPSVIEAAEIRNKQLYDSASNTYKGAQYIIESIEPGNIEEQKTQLSEKVKNKEYHAFLIVGRDAFDVYNPDIKYYSVNSLMDDIRDWIRNPVNNRLRNEIVSELNIPADKFRMLERWIDITPMEVGKVKSGSETEEDSQSNIVSSMIIPYVFLFLMFMLIMMSATPLLNSVMEEKSERIAEVLLGSVTPFEFMMGKVLGSISVSLVGSSVYLLGGIFVLSYLGHSDLVPFHLLPWFFAYLLVAVVMVGSFMAALGSACNDMKEAQSLSFPAMLPVMLPMFMLFPVMKAPLGSFATTMSLIPPFTPMLMIVRQASPVEIPAWQPYAGLLGVILFTVFIVWAGGKIFRTMILMQGVKPSLMNIIKYAFKK